MPLQINCWRSMILGKSGERREAQNLKVVFLRDSSFGDARMCMVSRLGFVARVTAGRLVKELGPSVCERDPLSREEMGGKPGKNSESSSGGIHEKQLFKVEVSKTVEGNQFH